MSKLSLAVVSQITFKYHRENMYLMSTRCINPAVDGNRTREIKEDFIDYLKNKYDNVVSVSFMSFYNRGDHIEMHAVIDFGTHQIKGKYSIAPKGYFPYIQCSVWQFLDTVEL
jgi:hypothetical protein